MRQLLESDQQRRATAEGALDHPWFSLSGPRLQQALQISDDCFSDARLASSNSVALKIAESSSREASPKSSSKSGPCPPVAPKKGLVKVPLCLGPKLRHDSDS